MKSPVLVKRSNALFLVKSTSNTNRSPCKELCKFSYENPRGFYHTDENYRRIVLREKIRHCYRILLEMANIEFSRDMENCLSTNISRDYYVGILYAWNISNKSYPLLIASYLKNNLNSNKYIVYVKK